MASERDFFFKDSEPNRSKPDSHFHVAGGPPPFAAQMMASQLSVLDALEDPQQKKSKAGRLAFEIISVLALGMLLAGLFHTFVTQVYAISGRSMEPTLHNGERVVIHKLSPSLVDIEHGDIVILALPNRPERNLIKRVIGLPGDEISIIKGTVHLNGVALKEDYAQVDPQYLSGSLPKEKIPEGYVFVMGDNRPQSMDSRHFSSVPLSAIKGSVFMRLWPLDQISTFP